MTTATKVNAETGIYWGVEGEYGPFKEQQRWYMGRMARLRTSPASFPQKGRDEY